MQIFSIITELSTDYQEIHFGEVVGRGTFGIVYKGAWKGQTVALKRIQIPPGIDKNQVLTAERLQYWGKDYQVLLQFVSLFHIHIITWNSTLLKHPNIVSLLGLSASAEEIVLIMNFVTGSNLYILIFGKDKILSKVCGQINYK